MAADSQAFGDGF